MSVSAEQTPQAPIDAPAPVMGPWARAVAVFTRPAQAWAGLEQRVQWWFPVLLLALVWLVLVVVTYERTLLPTMLGPLQQKVADGEIPAAQLDKIEAFFVSPAGRAIYAALFVVQVFLGTLLTSLFTWFGGAFLLGRKFRYRLALEVTGWAGLITIPAGAATFLIGWFQNSSLRDVHLGFGALLPVPETPSKLLAGLAVFLDALGPLGIWYAVVMILGVSVLSGTTRKQSAWVMGALYLAQRVLEAGLVAMSAPGR